MILHGSQNAITQDFFAEYTTKGGNSVYYVSEIGALIAIAWIAAAYIYWRKRHALSTGPAGCRTETSQTHALLNFESEQQRKAIQ